MEDVTSLVLQVRSGEVTKATVELRLLTQQAKRTETATGGLMTKWKAFTGLLAGAVSIGTVIAGLRKLMDVAKQFESLEAQLKTATGTAENAAIAFEALTEFATQTPYNLAQSVEAFIKLTNLGLTPSERALRSYGDTASAMGKDLSAMVQAVANATTGEFEMLKQFGVKSRTEADGIAFSFRGVTTKVKNDAKSIEEYFISLGETNFSGAMIDRMNTLEGKLSNLGDAWDQMFAAISKAGAGDVMKDLIDRAIAAIEELTAMIVSGELAGYIDAIAFKFSSLTYSVEDAFNGLSSVFSFVFGDMKEEGNAVVDFLVGAFKDFPENVRAYFMGMGATWGLLVEYGSAAGKGIYEAIAGYFNLLIETAKNVGKEIYSNLNPMADDFDFIGAQAKAMEEFGNRTVNAWDDTVASINNASDAYGEVITEIMDERDASLAAYEAKIAAAKEAREAYNSEREARKLLNEQGGDRLARFGVGTRGRTSEFEKFREELKTQETLLAESHAKRRQLILDNTGDDLALQMELLARENELYEQDRKDMLNKIGLDLEVRATLLEDANAIEMELLKEGYDQKQMALDDALAARLVSEDEYARRSKQLEERRTRDVSLLATQSFAQVKTQQLNIYSDVLTMAGNIANQMSGLVEGNNAAAKATFIAAKAIAIAQAIVYTELAAVRALAEGGVFAGIPLSALIRGTGYASVALMAATSVQEYGGKFADGGIVPGSSFAGDRVTANVNSGEMVLNFSQQKRLFEMANGSGGTGGAGGNLTVIVNNQAGGTVEAQERETDDGKVLELTIKRVEQRLSTGIRSGGSPLARAVESTYKLNRAS